MNPIEDYQDVLQNTEFAVVDVWRTNRAMTNYTVMRAYDAALTHYTALAREHTPKPSNLTGLDAMLFEAVKGICEWRLGHSSNKEETQVEAIPVEDLIACLRRLRKSVDHWTKEGGRQGYLQFIEQFLL